LKYKEKIYFIQQEKKKITGLSNGLVTVISSNKFIETKKNFPNTQLFLSGANKQKIFCHQVPALMTSPFQ